MAFRAQLPTSTPCSHAGYCSSHAFFVPFTRRINSRIHVHSDPRQRSQQTVVCVHAPQHAIQKLAASVTGLACSAVMLVSSAQGRLEGVNKPELLPNTYTPVIDVAGFLTPGEESRIVKEVQSLEEDTGIKLRVLAQNYPQTPGLAIKDYWKVDDDTVVFVADPSLGGNILNFNVGTNIDLRIPRNFWTRLGSKYGTKYYWQERGEGIAIVNAVSAIDTCAREPVSRLQCSKILGEFGEEPSAGPIEKMFLGG